MPKRAILCGLDNRSFCRPHHDMLTPVVRYCPIGAPAKLIGRRHCNRRGSAVVAACSRVPHMRNMSEHKVTLKWERGGAEFSYQKYPRDHTWSFDGGHTMAATAAPAYLGNPAHVDPEEAFVCRRQACDYPCRTKPKDYVGRRAKEHELLLTSNR